MKSYLSLVPISARVRKRQNRMTIFCIIISVFLVTAIFSLVDMFTQAEELAIQERHGSWHIRLENVPRDAVEEIGRRRDVAAAGWSDSFNSDTEQPYYLEEKKAVLYGTDETYMVRLMNGLEEGAFPGRDDEVMVSANAKLALGVRIGDHVTLHTPAGDAGFTISGFGTDDKDYYRDQTYLVAVYMTEDAFHTIMAQNNNAENPACYVKFQNAKKASEAKTQLQEAYGLSEDDISENTAVMGIAGQSGNESISGLYEMAVFLFTLVLLAGVLMISGSLNSNVAQRTKFFGMMRCIGASRQQIIRFVRLEALSWCKTAVPAGLILGTVVSWGLCAWLRYGVGGDELATMPVFSVSAAGLVSGTLVGIITVLLAAQAPAKKAARVSPVSAVSGNSELLSSVRHAGKGRWGKIECTLGIYHATGSGQNWFLMTASFALSIILALCFSVGMDFARGLLPTLRSFQPDLSLNGYENALVLEQDLLNEIRGIAGVRNVFGSAWLENIPVVSSRQGIDHIDLESYDEFLLESAQDRLVYGDLSDVAGDSGRAMIVQSKDNPLEVGDILQIGKNEVEITCAVSDSLFPGERLVICSRETFERLTGEQNDTMIGIQLDEKADDETIRQINGLIGSDVIFTDHREKNRSDKTTFMATQALVYGFLAIIGMITMFYTINSISISVTARTKQYGAMRAVGMSGRQLTRMVAAEAFTYAVCGLIVGCGIGIWLSRFLHIRLVTRYFGAEWEPPVAMLCIIAGFVFACAAAAVYAPAKRLRNMAITAAINDL